MSPVKSVLLAADAQNKAKYSLYPIDEFSKGNFYVAVSSISYETTEIVSTTCMITTNFVTGTIRTTNNDIKVVEVN